MTTAKTIDDLPLFSGDTSAAHTLVRVNGVTYRAPVAALAPVAGAETLGGYPVGVTAPGLGDVLSFGSGQWVNEGRENLVDGGNF